ncbi:MAG: cob(I)yrinic acid a,c-diamide adenosyltransferase [Synergistota bacterium]|jgi:cob(I)alamin adenosyltransferase|nr:cob(I)yrinic acid a,c-diamide adenosyltransferase [Synergistota bacterium]
MKKGYLSVNTGDGKGKTTAAVGQALRALGAGYSVYVGQFLKSDRSGEIRILREISSKVVTETYGIERNIGSPMTERDREAAKEGLTRLKEAIDDGYDLVIADEILVAMSSGLLEESELLDLMKSKPESVELVMTGRGATQAIIDRADVVTEMVEIKHHYRLGVQAREGIER